MSKVWFLAASAAALLAASTASADVIAQWTFETSVPLTAGPHVAEAGTLAASSFATGFHADSTVAYSNPVGNGSGESFSSDKWAIGDYYQFSTSSVNYTGITITWDQTRSATGPQTFSLFASADGFATSSLLSTYTVAQVTWSSGTYMATSTFSPVAAGGAFANQANLSFRLVNQAAPGASGGTNRVDNIKVEGTFVPAPSSVALVGLAGLVAARRRRA